MTKMSIAELWRASSQIFPILQQAVEELDVAPGLQPTAQVRQRFVRTLRRHGLDVRPLDGLDAAWLVNNKVCVRLIPADADLAAQAAALRAAIRQEGIVRGGYLIQLSAKPRWRWVQTSAAPLAGQTRPEPPSSSTPLEQQGGQDGS